ncbi:MAG: glycosyltransferase family A protein, partial [Nitrososphaerales archaeon]
LYSICMLCYNDAKTLRQSIESLLPLSRLKNIEIIIVDNKSNDGSDQTLSQYQNAGLIKYVSRKCSRGLGRQVAFENSKGDFILACMDCDDEFIPENVNRLIDLHHEKHEGSVMMTKKTKKNEKEASNITIAPRSVVIQVGGWRDINWCEDWDFWARAAAIGKYAFESYPYSYPPHKLIKVRVKRETDLISRFATRYNKYKDFCRIGRPPFAVHERVSLNQKVTYRLAKIIVRLRGNSLTPVPNPGFSDAEYSG